MKAWELPVPSVQGYSQGMVTAVPLEATAWKFRIMNGTALGQDLDLPCKQMDFSGNLSECRIWYTGRWGGWQSSWPLPQTHACCRRRWSPRCRWRGWSRCRTSSRAPDACASARWPRTEEGQSTATCPEGWGQSHSERCWEQLQCLSGPLRRLQCHVRCAGLGCDRTPAISHLCKSSRENINNWFVLIP